MALTNRLGIKVNTASELASYIINQNPILSAEVDLPTQGDANYLPKLGELISSDNRYKNAFLNTVNEIAMTVIRDNTWNNPWDAFTEKGSFRFGESVRELYVDIANVYDYHEYENDVDHFLDNVVPDVYNYIHILNYEKFYKTTTSDEQISMAFRDDRSFFNMIESIVASLYEGYKYDKYIVEKYMLCKRILDGTMTAIQINNSLDNRGKVAFMKSISNKMTFRNPKFNPAGVKSFSPFDRQYLIMDTDFEAQVSTITMAQSYFRDEADFRTNMALIDGYNNHDTVRLAELLGIQTPFTSDELTALATIPAVIVDRDFFQVYNKAFDTNAEVATRMWENPETLKTNHWLHTKKIISTSPFAPAVVFTTAAPSVTSVNVSPSSASVAQGSSIKLNAIVTTVGFANKAVTWSVDEAGVTAGLKIDVNGNLTVPSDATATSYTITATSIYDSNVYGTASITVASSTLPSITSVTVTAAGSATQIAANSTLQMSATVVRTGNASQAVTWSVDSAAATDGFSISATGLLSSPVSVTVDEVTVTATSVFDDTKKGTKKLTISS